MEKRTEADWVRGCRRGDPKSWREMIDHFSPLTYRLALRMLRSSSEAEDACQEVFIRMFRSLDSFDASRPLTPWISRITYHVCLQRLHKSPPYTRGRLDGSHHLDELETLAAPSGADPERSACQKQVAVALEEAIGQLPAQDRALLVMRYREGLSDSEVSQAVDMPVGTVKTRIYRARHLLKKLLAPRERAL